MYLVGLTGGVAAGKSTVASRWVELGAVEIDADALAREAISPGSPGLRQVVDEFGSDIVDATGQIDRAKLRSIVFSNATLRKKLEAIVHPAVRLLAQRQISQCQETDIVIYNVPLLVEANVDLPFDFIATVEAPEAEQIKRMVSSRGLTAEAAKAIISSQAQPAARANVADAVINANQPLALMLKDVDQLFKRFQRELRDKAQG